MPFSERTVTGARRSLPLARLDAALAREVARLRARYQLSLDEFRGVFVSDEQVDSLLARNDMPVADPDDPPPPEPHAAIDALAVAFGLDDAAVDVLIFALGPDIDPAYAPMYAYLNDDVRRRWPTVDLTRRLFGDTAPVWSALAADGPLFGPGLLLPHAAGEARVPLPLLEFAANPVLAAALLGSPVARVGSLTIIPPAVGAESGAAAPSDEAFRMLAVSIAAGARPTVVLTGGAEEAASVLATLSRRTGRALVRVAIDGDAAAAAGAMRDGMLAARLTGGLLAIEADPAQYAQLPRWLRDPPVPVFLPVPAETAWRHSLTGVAAIEYVMTPPDAPARRALWDDALRHAGTAADPGAIEEVADRFRLAPARIAAAARVLAMERDTGLRQSPSPVASPNPSGAVGSPMLTRDDLLAAAQRQAGADLGTLAERLTPTRGWNELILPAGSLHQLRLLSGAIRHRERVFARWGFGGGPGVAALFSGGPGTGKSMTAGVLAREAGLELWRIDLSAVVSKYIGETEKQLDRIFAQARHGNAVLFFDEADALFGKRSEVKDAHDRYANIEVAYLLQRLEGFDGVVVLASNLARNVDQAFSRRMHFVIEFPMPDPGPRERLWRAAIPANAPVADDVDLGFLARQFSFAGGDIGVAALDAAFSAAADGVAIDMARLCQAVARQLLKQGKVPAAADFRQYQTLLASTELAAIRRAAE